MTYLVAARRALAPAVAFATLASFLPAVAPSLAHDEGHAGSAAGPRAEILVFIEDAEKKLIQLAEAMPEEKYGWSPDAGVRTVGQVFMHVAAANFGIPGFIGAKTPEGFKFQGYESSLTKKAEIVKALRDSFAFVKESFKSMPDADLEKPAEFFGLKTTRRGAYVLLLSHEHEHLGQAIAYARFNKVTPPWSAREK